VLDAQRALEGGKKAAFRQSEGDRR
jgi:hypothetical protein